MKQASILIIDDDTGAAKEAEDSLMHEGFKVKAVTKGEKVISAVKKHEPDLILLDIMPGDENGFEIKEELNRDKSTALVPVIFLTAKGGIDKKFGGHKKGAYNYIVKPYEIDDLVARIDAVLTRIKFYEDISMTDKLTGLYNRQYLEKQLNISHQMARRYQRPYSLAIIDIDDFKKINDTHGRDTGDFILKKTAEIIKDTVRKMDLAARYGEDDFVVMLPGTNNKQVKEFIGRLKNKINGKKFKYKEKVFNFNISTGYATSVSGEVSPEKIFRLANIKMYRDKKKLKKQKEKNVVLIIEDEKDIADGVKMEMEAEGFHVLDILNTFDDSVNYVRDSSGKKGPNFIILDLDLAGNLSCDFLGEVYGKWKNTDVFIFTAYPGYVEMYPFLEDIVEGIFDKSDLDRLISIMKERTNCELSGLGVKDLIS